jgi:NAD(P)H dehydrogenase (quinone)
MDEYCSSIAAMGVPPYVVQHLGGAMADYDCSRATMLARN